MGGRGASSGLKYTKHKGYSSYGKEYGSEYQTVLQVGHIKFVKPNKGSATAPMETRAGAKRIYVTLDKKDNPKFLTIYGKNGQREKQIDLRGKAHYVSGTKVNTPHTHLGYVHSDGGTRTHMTSSEEKLVDRAIKEWDNYRRGK